MEIGTLGCFTFGDESELFQIRAQWYLLLLIVSTYVGDQVTGSGKSRCSLSFFHPVRALGPPIFAPRSDLFPSLYLVGSFLFAHIFSPVREPVSLPHVVDLA